MKFSFIDDSIRQRFVSVKKDEIQQVECELGIVFPETLALFLTEIGYGSFSGEYELDENCVLSPTFIKDFRLRRGLFDGYPNENEANKLVFFIGWESVPFSIELVAHEQHAIYQNEKKIANSLEAFLLKIIADSECFQPD